MIAALDRLHSLTRSRRAPAPPAPHHASIFVTVGTELPFDRLVRAVDTWAGETGRGGDVFAQIGRTGFQPEHIRWASMLEGHDFRRLFAGASLIVAHAGMGTILAALEADRPLIVVPRRADLREHRNDHQLSTARRLGARQLVRVAFDEAALRSMLDLPFPSDAPSPIGQFAEPNLIAALRSAVRGTSGAR